jgi:hypothetical protein
VSKAFSGSFLQSEAETLVSERAANVAIKLEVAREILVHTFGTTIRLVLSNDLFNEEYVFLITPFTAVLY